MHSSHKSNAKGYVKFDQMTIEYHPQAEEELIAAAQFYEPRQEGLGTRFLTTIEIALNSLQKNPLIWSAGKSGIRKYPIRKFPYLIIYKVRKSQIFILAVAHPGRKPDYWKSRGDN